MQKNEKIIFSATLLLIALVISACVPFAPRTGQPRSITAKGVFKSLDRGLNWQEQNNLQHNTKQSLGRYSNHQLAFDIFDSQIIYRATSVGLFISENSGESWRQIFKQSVNDFVLNPKSRGIIYVVSGGQVFKTTNNGESWQLVYSESKPNVTISSVAISSFDTSYIYLLTSDGLLLLSVDWGDSWKTLHNFKAKAHQLYLNPFNSQHIYVATDKGLFRSLDEGHSWQEIINDLRNDYPGLDRFKQLLFADQGQTVYYLSKYGILKSYNAGDSWQPLKLITPPNSVDISTFALNPNSSQEIFYIVGKVLYHSLNGGLDWQTKVVPVPDKAQANQILIDPHNGDIVYLSIG